MKDDKDNKDNVAKSPDNTTVCPACVARMKSRDKDSTDYKKLVARLNKIEGQVRGVKKMLEDDRYCIDVLNQSSAIISALNSFNKELLIQHIKSCVVEDIKNGQDEKVDELIETLSKLMK